MIISPARPAPILYLIPLGFLLLFPGLAALGAERPMAQTTPDPHSHGNPHQIRVEAVRLKLDVDLDRRLLQGVVELSCARQSDCPKDAPLIVDAKGLIIDTISARNAGKDLGRLKFRDGPEDPILGRSVAIDFPPGLDRVAILISYRTRPNAGALQWLEPKQTSGGKKPFLFTQSEAIQARTWIPLQDSPGVRVTWSAMINAPEGVVAVMAGDPDVDSHEPKGVVDLMDSVRFDRPARPNPFFFRMSQPIPSYLIALAVGDLAFRPLGPRTGVWAEPSVLAKAAHEFADTEAMVKATEARFGPYRWGRYDLLVLPPSFPFGGMENPKLTFATPTILAGDRSLVALVAHELAHSWSGNLVTNATWNDFWLNEGFTVYLERRIVEAVYGVDRAKMEAVLGVGELREELGRLDARDQTLQLSLKGRDPDDGMTQVAYEKGALFLTELERVFGREQFDRFLRAYFDAHAFQSITTADFATYLQTHLLDPHPDLASKIDVAAWLRQPGLQVPFEEPTSERLQAVDRDAQAWASGQTPAKALATSGWATQEWLQFLRKLPDPLSVAKMTELDAAFGLTARENSEIAAQWLMMAAKNQYHPADARIEAFLTSVGRRKFILPIYRELIQTPVGRTKAQAIYAKARGFYHPIAIESVDKLLGR